MSTGNIYLITQADDLGGSNSANRAIAEAMKGGILRNASLMVTCEAAVEAAKLFRDRHDLCIGLHGVINAEWDQARWGPILPPGQVPSLVRADGTFQQSPAELRANGFEIEEIMAELAAQLAYARELGFKPVYADTHMRFEWIDTRLPKRFDDWCASEGLISYRRLFRELPSCAAPADDPSAALLQRIEAAGSGLWAWLTHPAVDNDEVRNWGNRWVTGEQIATERDLERRLLQTSGLAERLLELGVRLVRYDEAIQLLGG